MKIKAFALLASIILYQTICLAQTSSTKKDQYRFLRWYINQDQPGNLSDTLVYLDNSGFNTSDLKSLSRNSKFMFSQKDVKFIIIQMKNNRKIKSLDTSGLGVISWRRKNDPRIPVTKISLPVFTINKNKVLIYKSYWCGPLCGEGGVDAFQKIKGKWKKLNIELIHWVS